jgi:hypothetical protein
VRRQGLTCCNSRIARGCLPVLVNGVLLRNNMYKDTACSAGRLNSLEPSNNIQLITPPSEGQKDDVHRKRLASYAACKHAHVCGTQGFEVRLPRTRRQCLKRFVSVVMGASIHDQHVLLCFISSGARLLERSQLNTQSALCPWDGPTQALNKQRTASASS